MRLSIAEAYRINQRCIRDAARVEAAEVAALVIECVHPGNLGCLPPSPRWLVYKAAQIGLLSNDEAAHLVFRCGY